ncbi:MAG: putative selenate ABC transporter substrate-binding protein [Planctomycetes bacterium]|nr:putative selenate ABC transporter substrate-binding protein [Planctomycetota bacterium]
MVRFSKILLSALLVAFPILLTACGEGDKSETGGAKPAVFTFTAIPDADETKLREMFNPLAEYLSQELGLKVEYKPVTSYDNAVNAMTSGDVFLAWFGGLSGVQARARTKGEAIAQGAEDTAFYSYFIAHKSTGLQAGDDFPKGIEGKTFTFGSQGSTSGRLMPEFYIRKHLGKAPEAAFKSVAFSGSHSNTLRAVREGGVEVGAINYTDWEKAVEEGETGDAIAIWKTPTFYDYNWSVPGNIDEVYGQGFKAKLEKALLALDTANPAHKKILDAFRRSRFIPARNSDYQAIEDTAKSIGIIR